jgi:predicted DCC family thiol-disulfide oxidoreductase YuxK
MVEPLTVWYDDDCGVCSASVRFLAGRSDDSVIYRPNHELDALDLRGEAADAIVVTGAGSLWTAVDAVLMVLARTGRPGRVGATLLRMPGIHGMAGFAYRAVARNRAWISARLGLAAVCEMPRADSA